MIEPSLFAPDPGEIPLAHRMRPIDLDGFVGQTHLVGPGRPLRESIERGHPGSMILWGPPGCGKTSLARVVATYTDHAFEPFSAVTEGVPRVRTIIAEARRRRETEGRRTLLFCDEIHRFNKAQQDAFLPWVEEGVVTLIGATTENPSFELNAALLSRVQVYVLEPLDVATLEALVYTAVDRWHADRPDDPGLALTADAVTVLARQADGDARRALNGLEAVLDHVASLDPPPEGAIDAELVQRGLARRMPRYDKTGEEHYNLVSALHKSVRGSDVEGALYWLARMLAGGEDARYLARRIIRIATEDIGLADPRGLAVAVAAKDAYEFLGSPEGELALAEAVIYLATAPKSNRAYVAWQRAQAAARERPADPVPHVVRNAPTRLMRELGYGEGYQYDPDTADGIAVGQSARPPALADAVWYQPGERGFERTIAERLAWWAERRAAGGSADPPGSPPPEATQPG